MAIGRSGRPPRFLTERFLAVAYTVGIVTLAVVVLWAGALVYLTADSHPHSEPANTPLSEVLVVGAGRGSCASGNASYAWNCSYSFGLRSLGTNGLPTLTLQSLNFEAVDSNGAILGSPFSVTVIGPSGCGLGAYNASINAWGPSTIPGPCGPSYSNASQIQSGDSLTVATIPRGGLPFSGAGDQLWLIGVGEFGGVVRAPFD
jgi:hypothetical protein